MRTHLSKIFWFRSPFDSVYGEYKFSSLPMPPPSDAQHTGGRLSGKDLSAYFQAFADEFLSGKIRLNTDVKNIRRSDQGGWNVVTQDVISGAISEHHFDKVVLCSGVSNHSRLRFRAAQFCVQGCTEPHVPENLSSEAAKRVGFTGPILHSLDFTSGMSSLLDAVKPETDKCPGHVLIIGGGKSAQE